MSTTPIDYDALAKQYGATASQPAGMDYDALAKQYGAINSTPAQSQQATISAGQPTGAAGKVEQWASDLGGDIKYGTGRTIIGRILAGLGAKGTNVGVPEQTGDFMGSAPLGLTRMLKGGAELPQSGKTWQGAKDVVGGGLQASTIPAAFMAPGAAEELPAAADAASSAMQKVPLLRNLAPGAMKAGAEEGFNAASKVAGADPVAVEGAGQAGLGAMDLQSVGRTMPRVMQKFMQRVTTADADPLSYDEARRFYSAAGELSANEKAAYTPAMKRALNQFRQQLGTAIQQTADNAGVGTEYGQAMSDYAKAKRLEDTWDTVWGVTQKYLLPSLAKGVGAGAAYGAYRSLTK